MRITCSGRMTLRRVLPTLTLLISIVVCDIAPTVPWLPPTPIGAPTTPEKPTVGYHSDHSSVFVVSITVASVFSVTAIAVFLTCVFFKRRFRSAADEHDANDARQPDSDMKSNRIYGMTESMNPDKLKYEEDEEDCKDVNTSLPHEETFNELNGSSIYNVLHHPTDWTGCVASAKEHKSADSDYDHLSDDVKRNSAYDALQHPTDQTSHVFIAVCRNEPQTVDYNHLEHTDMKRDGVYNVLHHPTNQTSRAAVRAHASQALDYDHLSNTDADVKREGVYNVLHHPTNQTSRISVYANAPQTLDYDQLGDEVHPFFETGISTDQSRVMPEAKNPDKLRCANDQRRRDGTYANASQTPDYEEVNDKLQPPTPWTLTDPTPLTFAAKPNKMTDRDDSDELKGTKSSAQPEYEAVANDDDQPSRAYVNTSQTQDYEEVNDEVQPHSTACADPMPWIFKLTQKATTDRDELTSQTQDYDYKYEQMDGKVQLHSEMNAATDPMPWKFETKPNRMTDELRCAKSPAHIKYEEVANDDAYENTSPTLNRKQLNKNVQPQSEISAATDPIPSNLERKLSQSPQESDIEYEEVYDDDKTSCNVFYENTTPQPPNYPQSGGKTNSASAPLADQYTFI